jgi:hypothetical protein
VPRLRVRGCVRVELPPRAWQRGEIPTLLGVRRRRDSEVDVGANAGTGPGAPRFASELDVGAGQRGPRRHRQVGLAALTEVVWNPRSGPATPRERGGGREDDRRDLCGGSWYRVGDIKYDECERIEYKEENLDD